MSVKNLLQAITKMRQQDAFIAQRKIPVSELVQKAAGRKPRSLRRVLEDSEGPIYRIIAETKKASPSAGTLISDYHPEAIAKEYEAAGAVAISVLTEPHYFRGSGDDLVAVRQAVDVPILRKDFITEPYQLFEAAAWGADVVLLIAAALDHKRLESLAKQALELSLEPLIEVHTETELKQALRIPEVLIGVNSRDLRTLTTDLGIARQLAGIIPKERLAIAESGIRNADDLENLSKCGYRGFLIGEHLLRGGKPGVTLQAWLTAAMLKQEKCSGS